MSSDRLRALADEAWEKWEPERWPCSHFHAGWFTGYAAGANSRERIKDDCCEECSKPGGRTFGHCSLCWCHEAYARRQLTEALEKCYEAVGYTGAFDRIRRIVTSVLRLE